MSSRAAAARRERRRTGELLDTESLARGAAVVVDGAPRTLRGRPDTAQACARPQRVSRPSSASSVEGGGALTGRSERGVERGGAAPQGLEGHRGRRRCVVRSGCNCVWAGWASGCGVDGRKRTGLSRTKRSAGPCHLLWSLTLAAFRVPSWESLGQGAGARGYISDCLDSIAPHRLSQPAFCSTSIISPSPLSQSLSLTRHGSPRHFR